MLFGIIWVLIKTSEEDMSKTVGAELAQDPRIAQAKKLLLEALNEHTQKIKQVKPADQALKANYEKLLHEFGLNRGGALYYPYLGSGAGNGALVELEDGSVKYDFITGIGVHYFGHNHPKVVEAHIDAALANTTMNGHLQQNSDSARLIKLLLDQANKNGAKLNHCFLSTSGVMANENALKIAFQKRFPANRVLAFEKNFSGRTLAVSNITDKAAYRQGLPKTLNVDYVPFYDYQDHAGSIARAVEVLETHIQRYPCEHAVFMMELIQGEAGSWPGHKDFFHALSEVCKNNGISIFVDEVQSFARTSELFSFQYFEMDQYLDLVSIGKNSQVCATFFREDHKPKPGLISQTFTSSASAIRSGLVIIEEIVNNNFLGEDGKIMRLHRHFVKKLNEIHARHPDKIEGPWGIGGMVAMTLFKGDFEKSKAFTFKLFENGALSFTAGAKPTRVRFLLPVGAINESDIDKVSELIELSLTQV